MPPPEAPSAGVKPGDAAQDSDRKLYDAAYPPPLREAEEELHKQRPKWQPEKINSTDPPAHGRRRATADAIYYNDLCSLDKGLQTLTQSLSTAGNPGLDEFYGEVQKYNQIRDAMRRGAPAPLAAPATANGEAVNRRRAR